MTRQILHVDMDAFYAAIEQRDDPTLRGRPVIVGGSSPRAVVATCSYEARRFGCHSAMPMYRAMRLCPEAVIVPVRMRHYAEVSEHVMAILHGYSPLVEPLSLDEAFIDVTGSRALFGDGVEVAKRIRADIREQLNLTASAGVASSKFVAKVASDLEKPDGLTVVPPGEEAAFLAPLPIRRMWGVGPKAEERLKGAGFKVIGDLARATAERLEGLLGSWGRAVHELARGIDDRVVIPHRDASSIGAEETFDRDLAREDEIAEAILAQASRVARRLTAAGVRARTVVLKLKLTNHKLLSRQRTLDFPACDTVTLHQTGCELLPAAKLEGRAVRLVGITAKDLVFEDRGKALFEDATIEKRAKLERTLLEVRSKFGEGALLQAGVAQTTRGGRRR